MSCGSSDPPTYCSAASPELKLYQAFIFSVPVFFTFILLLLFYLSYLRRRRAHWQSLRLRASQLGRGDVPRVLPFLVPLLSPLVDTTRNWPQTVEIDRYRPKSEIAPIGGTAHILVSDYQSDERLQRIPPCGHTFHVDCIDHWLATNTTCPLCRVSLLTATKSTASDFSDHAVEVELGSLEEQSSERPTNSGLVNCRIEAAEEQRDGAVDLSCVRREAQQLRHDEEGSVSNIIEADRGV
ncbi:hypothetical protein GW17_00044791 [Ensete ventricosum]|nr:hypothetical protein GW17_00044791 [Ensete ventricosum]